MAGVRKFVSIVCGMTAVTVAYLVWRLRTCTHGSNKKIQFPFAAAIVHKLQMEGLYDPRHEHDSCGVGFVVDIKGRRSNAIVRQALQVLINLLHRGACGCEANTGDGAGILIQMPDKFLRKEALRLGIELPPARQYGAGFVFLPREAAVRAEIEALFERTVV